MHKLTDALGEVLIEDDVYYGSSTSRALHFFKVNVHNTLPAVFHQTFMHLKLASMQASARLGLIDPALVPAIRQACLELLEAPTDMLVQHFPLSIWQSGSGTQYNMNYNEVIAAKANMILARTSQQATVDRIPADHTIVDLHNIDRKHPVHPNNHINLNQSSNDSFLSVMHISLYDMQQKLVLALKQLQEAFLQKAVEFEHHLKVARTHLQDAILMPVAAEWQSFAHQVEYHQRKLDVDDFLTLPQGGTAIGSGIIGSEIISGATNPTPLTWEQAFIIAINTLRNKSLKQSGALKHFSIATDKYMYISNLDIITRFSTSLSALASCLLKIAQDIRLLSSGPNCGFNEVILPSNELGSSIMPGKINPSQLEILIMSCVKIIGDNQSILMCNSLGQLQLNVTRPLVLYLLLDNLQSLSSAINNTVTFAINGLKLNLNTLQHNTQNCNMLLTYLTKIIGYDDAARATRYSIDHNIPLTQALADLKILSLSEAEAGLAAIDKQI